MLLTQKDSCYTEYEKTEKHSNVAQFSKTVLLFLSFIKTIESISNHFWIVCIPTMFQLLIEFIRLLKLYRRKVYVGARAVARDPTYTFLHEKRSHFWRNRFLQKWSLKKPVFEETGSFKSFWRNRFLQKQHLHVLLWRKCCLTFFEGTGSFKSFWRNRFLQRLSDLHVSSC